MHYFVKGNPDLCIGCRTCMIGCVVAHEGLHIFEVDPDSYTFNPKLHMVKTLKLSTPIHCKHCESPACMAACINGCITIQNGVVLLDQEECIGCKACMTACPFGAIDMVTLTEVRLDSGEPKIVANKCDLCHGIEGGPVCVDVCLTGALTLVEEEDLNDMLERRRVDAARALDAAIFE